MRALRDLARYDEARAVYERVLVLFEPEQRAVVYREFGQLHEARGELRDAEEFFRPARPHDAVADPARIRRRGARRYGARSRLGARSRGTPRIAF
jgi:hypothetical protein